MAVAISEWLPQEIICEITQAASPSDQAALCRTSKLFHALGVPVLYRVVEVTGYASIISFCSTILSDNTKFPEHVRSITIALEYDDSRKIQYLERPLLSDCLKTLLKIESLSISGCFLDETWDAVQASTFPCLVRCVLSCEYEVWTSTEKENTPASFLMRHPALESVWIQLSDGGLESWSSTRIPLPNLKRICAPLRLFPSIIASNLQKVNLRWGKSEPIDPTFITLRSMTHSGVPFICTNECWSEQYMPIVDSLSRHIPHTRTLQISINYPLPNVDEIIARTIHYLPGFTCLAFFALTHSMSASIIFKKNIRKTRTAAQAFGDACPSLQGCCFYDTAWRKVDGMWERFPLADSRCWLVFPGLEAEAYPDSAKRRVLGRYSSMANL
ncbi:hypothetical protein B0H19DRAFT_1374329, partial [Mycena capillaripes]